jgi:hypothetical protein
MVKDNLALWTPKHPILSGGQAMKLPKFITASVPLALLGIAGCTAPQLGPVDGNGLVVLRATLAVQCVKTGYVNPTGQVGLPRNGEWAVPALALVRPTGLPAASLIETDDGVPPPLWLVRQGRSHGGGYGYTEPACNDAPSSFAADTNTVDRGWIESGSVRVEGRRVGDVLLFNEVPSGMYRLVGLEYNYSFGGQDYVTRIPSHDVPPDRFPDVTIQAAAGQPRYAGTLSVHATRDVEFLDRFDVSFRPAPESEGEAWREVLSKYPQSPWASRIADILKAISP